MTFTSLKISPKFIIWWINIFQQTFFLWIQISLISLSVCGVALAVVAVVSIPGLVVVAVVVVVVVVVVAATIYDDGWLLFNVEEVATNIFI